MHPTQQMNDLVMKRTLTVAGSSAITARMGASALSTATVRVATVAAVFAVQCSRKLPATPALEDCPI